MPKIRLRYEQLDQQAPLIQQGFQEIVDPRILTAPRLDWSQVHPKLMNYLNTYVADAAWLNHLALLLGISICSARLDMRTMASRLFVLHGRWRLLCHVYDMKDFSTWDPAEYFPRYMKDPNLEDSFETRHEFLRDYTAAVRTFQRYLSSLPEEEQAIYRQWSLPPLPPGMREQLYHGQELEAAQAMRRKAESDAVAPHFARVRGEAHVRWNEVYRLRQKYREVVHLVQAEKTELPVAFSYVEQRRQHRLHFRLWDRPSFALAHAQQYSTTTIQRARDRIAEYSPEHNHFFLEFTGAERLSEPDASRDPDALLWFGDLLRHEVLGQQVHGGTPEERQRKQAYLRSWGYVGKDEREERVPFSPDHPGLIAGTRGDGTSSFLREAQRRSNTLVLTVEPLFAAATFGLAALDFFTTTGARVGELLQVSLTPECLYTMQVQGIQRLLVKLVPKGSDKLADYMVGPETVRNFEKVADLLKGHYRVQPGESLPSVPHNPYNNRAHQFPEPRPYLFQYERKHLSRKAIAACMRFLCHGMVFQAADGKVVVLKAHLLRHVFATHLHQVEQVPLDLVAVILHQKNVRVTAYYAAPTWQQVAHTTDTLLDHFATQLGDIEQVFVRTPAELQRQYEEAKQRVGTLAKVPGGDCTCHALCPFSYVCTGCVYKVPDPARREEIVEQKQWALIRLDQVKRRQLGPETVKMEALLQRCNAELAEMDVIEEYRRDEASNPKLTLES